MATTNPVWKNINTPPTLPVSVGDIAYVTGQFASVSRLRAYCRQSTGVSGGSTVTPAPKFPLKTYSVSTQAQKTLGSYTTPCVVVKRLT